MKRNTKITNYIFALIVVYFSGAAILWGFNGFATAFFLAAMVIIIVVLWFAVLTIVESFHD